LALIQQFLEETPYDVCVLGGAEEQCLLPLLQKAIPENARLIWAIPNDVFSGLSLKGLLQTLCQAKLVIGGDTGPLHVAAALGVPVLGLYAPTDVARTGPRGPHLEIIQTLTPPADLECWPCERPICHQEKPCTNEISVKRVFEMVIKML
jgi:ADP-heptose:LPS heptosyltransferase